MVQAVGQAMVLTVKTLRSDMKVLVKHPLTIMMT